MSTIIIETNRLILKEFSFEDAESMYALNLDSEVLKFTGDKPFKSVDEAFNFIKNYRDYSKNGFGRWSVFLKENGSYIGWCGLKLNEENRVDVGFRFAKQYWSKGYATESAKACLDYGFNQLHIEEIIGRADTDNKASVKVLVKINMLFWKSGNFEGVKNASFFKLTKKQFNDINKSQ